MLEERSRRVGVFTSVEDGREGRHAAWFTESVKHATRLIITTEMRARRGVGAIDSWLSTLQELGLEEGQGVLERVRFGAGESATDGVRVETVHNEVV
jgi:hypothetical protein